MTIVINNINTPASNISVVSGNGASSKQALIPVVKSIKAGEAFQLFRENISKGNNKDYCPRWVKIEALVDGKKEPVYVNTTELTQNLKAEDKVFLFQCLKHESIGLRTHTVAMTMFPTDNNQ